MAFVKGQSGNPSGRPKVPNEIVQLARDNSLKAITRLVSLIDSAEEKIALQASNAVLDRAYGKPVQATELMGAGGQGLEINLIIKSKTETE